MTLRIKHGVDADLEAEADELIKASFLARPDPVAKALILTKWMQATRYSREVYVLGGIPDGTVRRGSFNRALNRAHPHLNAIEGVAGRPPRRLSLDRGAD